VSDRSFIARRHRDLLTGPLVSDQALRGVQASYQREAGDATAQRRLAREFERGVRGLLTAPGDAVHPLEEIRGMSPDEFFARYLVHPKGYGAGTAFVLEPWQKAFIDEFYRRDSAGLRVYKTGLYLVSRGSGKSPLAAGLGLYELLRQVDQPEVYCLAGSKLQAGIVLGFAQAFVQGNETLAGMIAVQRDRLRVPMTRATMEVRSAEGLTAHGLSPTVAIVDELHVLSEAQRELWVAMQTAAHKREDGYVLGISTVPDSPESLLGKMIADLHARLELERPHDSLVIGRDEESGILLWQIGAGEDADIDDRGVWARSNPASWISERDLARQRKAPGITDSDFARLHLNQVGADPADQLVPSDVWDACSDPELEIPDGGRIFVGGESSYGSSVAAWSWAWRADDGRTVLRSRVWAVASEATSAHERTAPRWRKRIDLVPVGRFLLELAERYDVQAVSYDRNELRIDPRDLHEQGLAVNEIRSGSVDQREGSRKLQGLIESAELAHDGDEVLRDHMLGTRGEFDTHGRLNVYRRRQQVRVDAWYSSVAAVMAMPDSWSVYESRGVLSVGPETLADRGLTEVDGDVVPISRV